MKILQVDTQLVKEPEIVITCAASKNIDRIVQNMLQGGSTSQQQQQQQQKKQRQQQQHYVTVVTDDKNDMVAVDYIEVLRAAKKVKIPKIPVLLLGRKDPMRTHISLQSVKSMVNPMRIGQALRLVRDDTTEALYLNAYVKVILQVEFEDDITDMLADFLDDVIRNGVTLLPPFSFFHALSKLDYKSQVVAMSNTVQIYKEIDLRHFTWPDSAMLQTMLYHTVAGKKDRRTKEAPPNKISKFDCNTCGTGYAVFDNMAHLIKDVEGCLLVQDELGTVLYPIPKKEMEFIKTDPDLVVRPRFSRHKNIDDLKDLKIDGPFLLVRPDSKE